MSTDWADCVLRFLPQWFLAALAMVVFVLSMFAWNRGRGVRQVDSWLFLGTALGTLAVAVFYVGAMIGYGDVDHGIAASRIAFSVLLFFPVGVFANDIVEKRMEPALVGAVLMAGAALAGTIYGAWAARNRAIAEVSIIADLNEEIRKLRADFESEHDRRRQVEARLEALEIEYRRVLVELEQWKRGTERLIKQLRDHNVEPAWIPPAREIKNG